MEVLIGIAVVVLLFWVFGQMSLDKPVNTWSDEELVRRLPKYMRLVSNQVQSGDWEASKKTNAKIDEIRAEIVSREKAHQLKQAAPLKQDSLLGSGIDSVITEKAIASADAGDIELQVLVGTAYLAGANGMPQDPVKAASYLLKAAEGGHAFASFAVAGLYAEGLGLPRNFDNARLWAMKAKALGAPDTDQLLESIEAQRRGA